MIDCFRMSFRILLSLLHNYFVQSAGDQVESRKPDVHPFRVLQTGAKRNMQ